MIVKRFIIFLVLLFTRPAFGQSFTRSELSATLSTPWEICYGADKYLWLTESGGRIARVDPQTGDKTIVFVAPDYFSGSVLEASPNCFRPVIGAGNLGMAMHPQFSDPAFSFIYFLHSYNHGTDNAPQTRFKIRRIKWDAGSKQIVGDTTLVKNISNGYDHFGGRVLIAPVGGKPFLFYTIGDHGISETNSPDCYTKQSDNPNHKAQDPAFDNGKVHRINLDGSVPADNPIPENSFYTRGHRNPQGLIYNNTRGIIYDVEHGDRTDDEINVLKAGLNYGWKNVRGYLNDDNYLGELAYINSYTPYPGIAGDKIEGPLYAWCTTPQPADADFLDWCTVAPSDGVYYGGTAIPEWSNSLLVTTLKDGANTDMEVYCFKLGADGLSLAPPSVTAPNPERWFGADQKLNGRLRDIALSPDGTKIFLINNGGTDRDKITVYTYSPAVTGGNVSSGELNLWPNPAGNEINISSPVSLIKLSVYNFSGELVREQDLNTNAVTVSNLPDGVYILVAENIHANRIIKKLIVKNNG